MGSDAMNELRLSGSAGCVWSAQVWLSSACKALAEATLSALLVKSRQASKPDALALEHVCVFFVDLSLCK